MKLIAMSLLLALGSTSFAAMAPEAFLGTYTLQSGPAKGCEATLTVSPGPNSEEGQPLLTLNVGQYFFEAINQGPQHYESELTISDSKSYTTDDNELIREGRLVTTFDNKTTWTVTKVKLNGKTLTIDSDIIVSTFGKITTSCTYQRAN